MFLIISQTQDNSGKINATQVNFSVSDFSEVFLLLRVETFLILSFQKKLTLSMKIKKSYCIAILWLIN